MIMMIQKQHKVADGGGEVVWSDEVRSYIVEFIREVLDDLRIHEPDKIFRVLELGETPGQDKVLDW